MSLVAINELDLIPLDLGTTSPQSQYPSTGLSHEGLNFTDLGVDRATTDVMLEVEDLSRRYTPPDSYSSAEEATTVLSQFCSVLQRLLSKLAPASYNDKSWEFRISESCRYAAALHVFTPLSGFYPDPTLMINALVHKLKASLIWLLSPTKEERNQLLLWLLAIGGISAVKTGEGSTSIKMPERRWFVAHLVVLVADLGIGSWEEFRHLVKITWYDDFCEVSLGRLWEDVALRKEALDTD